MHLTVNEPVSAPLQFIWFFTFISGAYDFNGHIVDIAEKITLFSSIIMLGRRTV